MYSIHIKANTFCFSIYWNKTLRDKEKQQKKKGLRKEGIMNNNRSKKWFYLTFKHCKLGTGVDLASTVSGCALVNGFISVCAQRLDPQYRA